MPRAGGSEAWFVKEEDEDGEDRPLWQCKTCPREQDCNAASLKDSCLFSYISEASVRQYISLHLQHSSKHLVTEEEAQACADVADVQTMTETAEQRDEYRKMMKNQNQAQKNQEQKRKWKDDGWESNQGWGSGKGGGGGGGWKKGKGKGDFTELNNMVKDIHQRFLSTAAPAPLALVPDNGFPFPALPMPSQPGPLMLSDAQLQPTSFQESVNRVENSLANATSQLIHTVRVIKEEHKRLSSINLSFHG